MDGMFRRRRDRFSAETHSPLLAMWYQARQAIAELTIPLLAGLKTIWLLLLTPANFFRAYFFGTRPLEQLHSPLDPFWRLLSREARRPLEAAQFLLFGIFTALLAGFSFDRSNRLSGFLAEQGIIETLLNNLSERSPALANLIANVEQGLANPLVLALQSFFDQTMVAALLELILTLLLTVVFAYLFYLLAGRRVSPTHSYPFWLYMTGLQFFTTGVTALLVSILSLAMLGLPPAVPAALFWLSDTGFRLLWFYLFPALVLPRIFPAVSARRVLVSAFLGRAILGALGWLVTSGAVLFLTLWSLVAG